MVDVAFVTNLLCGAVGAILGAVIGSVATVYLQRKSDRADRIGGLRFQIYMLMLELHGAHFWISSAEFRAQLADPEVRLKFDRLRWRVADLLRQADDIEELDQIVDVMFNLRFENESQRADEISAVIDKLGKHLNPNYQRAIKATDQENMRLMGARPDEFARRRSKLDRGIFATPDPGKGTTPHCW